MGKIGFEIAKAKHLLRPLFLTSLFGLYFVANEPCKKEDSEVGGIDQGKFQIPRMIMQNSPSIAMRKIRFDSGCCGFFLITSILTVIIWIFNIYHMECDAERINRDCIRNYITAVRDWPHLFHRRRQEKGQLEQDGKYKFESESSSRQTL